MHSYHATLIWTPWLHISSTYTHQWHNQSLSRIVMTNRQASMTQPITLSYRCDEQTHINDTTNHSVVSLWRTDANQWHNQSLCRIVMTNRQASMTQPITLSHRYDEQTHINGTWWFHPSMSHVKSALPHSRLAASRLSHQLWPAI